MKPSVLPSQNGEHWRPSSVLRHMHHARFHSCKTCRKMAWLMHSPLCTLKHRAGLPVGISPPTAGMSTWALVLMRQWSMVRCGNNLVVLEGRSALVGTILIQIVSRLHWPRALLVGAFGLHHSMVAESPL